MATLQRLEMRFLNSISSIEPSNYTAGEHKHLPSPQCTASSLAPSAASLRARNVLPDSLAKPDLSSLNMSLLQQDRQRLHALGYRERGSVSGGAE